VAEEVWSWWQAGSVHRATWPDGAELGEVGDAAVLDMASDLLGAIRRAKTEAKRSMKAPVVALRVAGPAAALELVRAAEADVREAGNIAAVEYADAPELSVDVELADEPAA
jgi:valyl-tRNA synthetase